MRRPVNRQPALKAQDLYLLLVLLAKRGEVLTYPELAVFSGLSMSEVHGALKRAEQARLLAFVDKQPRIIVPAFKEFLLHGARYAFPAARGGWWGGFPRLMPLRRSMPRLRLRPIRRPCGRMRRVVLGELR